MIRRMWDTTLTVSDLSRAIRFYGEILGLSLKYEFKDYAGFDAGGVELGVKTWGGRIALLQDLDGNTIQLTQIDWKRYFTACAGN